MVRRTADTMAAATFSAVANSRCRVCPVRTACLAYVLSLPPQPGIWGGTTEDQRRLRPKARPAS